MPASSSQLTAARRALKDTFGYDSFHPTQDQAIRSVLNGQDTFVLMPTGGGKSMCYQIPALVLDGTTVVVSPLIALMKDQVDGLRANGVAARVFNSSQTVAEQETVKQELLQGAVTLLYVSAERLVMPEFVRLLQQIKINLFAVDEAHCISQWGHDFRLEYTQLSHLKQQFFGVPIIALTATADAATRRDILNQLELKDPNILIDSFDRPNIRLTVLPGQKRIDKIKDFLADKSGDSGIIYCLTRKETENMAQKLQQHGLVAEAYHAGLSASERERIQKSFVLDKVPIICATIAFGMGIDKSNVRWVIHYNLPKNIEGYYQEIGRAGRDSAPADALLFYSYADVENIKRYFLDGKQGGMQVAKLDRMKEYAEAVSCRRQILLRAFGQELPQPCGNCDVCAAPYNTLDGTKIAHAALRTLQVLSATQLVSQKELVRDLSRQSDRVRYASWHFYLAQLKNQGYIDVNLRDQTLQLSPRGEEALQQEQAFRLVTLNDFVERQEKASRSRRVAVGRGKTAAKQLEKNPLYEELRELRRQIAQEKGLAAYMVFTDATLLEMAHEKPMTKTAMLNISGVGEVKWERYGERFVEVVGRG